MKHKLNPVLDAQLNRSRGRYSRGHRRNLSDPRFSTSLTDSYVDDYDVRIYLKQKKSSTFIVFSLFAAVERRLQLPALL